MKNEPIVIERSLPASADVIWKALTSKEEMKKWYFDIAGFKPEKGLEFQFTGEGKDGATQYVHLCKIMDVVPGKKISYTWRYEGYEGDSLVTFELFEEDGHTRVILTHEGLETFPAHINPDLAKENFVEGWTFIIGTSLPEYVAKHKAEAQE